MAELDKEIQLIKKDLIDNVISYLSTMKKFQPSLNTDVLDSFLKKVEESLNSNQIQIASEAIEEARKYTREKSKAEKLLGPQSWTNLDNQLGLIALKMTKLPRTFYYETTEIDPPSNSQSSFTYNTLSDSGISSTNSEESVSRQGNIPTIDDLQIPDNKPSIAKDQTPQEVTRTHEEAVEHSEKITSPGSLKSEAVLDEELQDFVLPLPPVPPLPPLKAKPQEDEDLAVTGRFGYKAAPPVSPQIDENLTVTGRLGSPIESPRSEQGKIPTIEDSQIKNSDVSPLPPASPPLKAPPKEDEDLAVTGRFGYKAAPPPPVPPKIDENLTVTGRLSVSEEKKITAEQQWLDHVKKIPKRLFEAIPVNFFFVSEGLKEAAKQRGGDVPTIFHRGIKPKASFNPLKWPDLLITTAKLTLKSAIDKVELAVRGLNRERYQDPGDMYLTSRLKKVGHYIAHGIANFFRVVLVGPLELAGIATGALAVAGDKIGSACKRAYNWLKNKITGTKKSNVDLDPSLNPSALNKNEPSLASTTLKQSAKTEKSLSSANILRNLSISQSSPSGASTPTADGTPLTGSFSDDELDRLLNERSNSVGSRSVSNNDSLKVSPEVQALWDEHFPREETVNNVPPPKVAIADPSVPKPAAPPSEPEIVKQEGISLAEDKKESFKSQVNELKGIISKELQESLHITLQTNTVTGKIQINPIDLGRVEKLSVEDIEKVNKMIKQLEQLKWLDKTPLKNVKEEISKMSSPEESVTPRMRMK